MEMRQTSPRWWANATRPAGRFGLQFIEMCLVMCAGGAILNFAVFGGAAFAGQDLPQSSPQVAILIVGIDWALAMAAWMAVRRHAWRHNVEMSSTAIVAALGFAVASWAGLIQVAAPLGWFSLFTLMCGPACLLMGADMLFHYKHYTASSAHAH